MLIPVDDVPPESDRARLADLVELRTTVAESEGAELADLHLADCSSVRLRAPLAGRPRLMLRDREGPSGPP